MNLKEIKEILQLMADHGLSEIEIEKDGLKLKLRKAANGRIMQEQIRESGPMMIPIPQAYEVGSEHGRPAQEAANPNVYIVKSPMVGTFYSSPAPDQPVYVAPGKKIKDGDVLCIVEAMKLMNEIKSEIAGTVLEVMVKNGQPVEFDQPLFKIQKG